MITIGTAKFVLYYDVDISFQIVQAYTSTCIALGFGLCINYAAGQWTDWFESNSCKYGIYHVAKNLSVDFHVAGRQCII